MRSTCSPGRKVALVEVEGLDRVGEVRLPGEREVDVAFAKRLQDLLVAHVLAGSEGAERDPERQPPGEEARAFGRRLAHESVPFENRVGEPIGGFAIGHLRPRFQAPGRDGDVVARRRHPRHAVESKPFAHRSSLVAVIANGCRT